VNAIRRHHNQRMKAKARRIRPGNPNAFKQADYLQSCSCMGCGHQRYWWGITRAELKFKLNAEEQEAEINRP
jgi:hypothetical protein